MKQFAPALLVLVCFTASAGATSQTPEVLIYNGRTCTTPVHPLRSCPTVNEKDLNLKDGMISTGNWRGYVATWEIAEDKLWLVGIETWINDGSDKKPFFTKEAYKKAALKDLFPGKVLDGRVHATWFTGRIHSPGYRWGFSLPREDRQKQEAESRLLIHVSEGVVESVEACDIPRLPRNPVIVCHGDSITAGGNLAAEEKYPAVLESLFPAAKVVNTGIGGNTSSQGLARLEKDVLTRKPNSYAPDLVLLLFGTNDSVLTAPGKYRVPVEKYQDNLRQMILRCRKADTEVILCTLLPIIPEPYFTRHPKEFYDAEGGLEKILHRYHAAAMEVGKELNVPVVDLYKTFEKDLTLLRPAPDGVHPNARGARAIAQEIAKLLSAERKPVPLGNVKKGTANER